MICKNCGEQLEENAKFCTKCGARTDMDGAANANINAGAANMNVNPSQFSVNPSQFTAPFPSGEAAVNTHKSKLPVIIAVILVIAAIAIAGAVAFLALTGNSSKAGSMSPQEYFQYVETKSLDESTGTTSSAYKCYYDIMHGNASSSQVITLNVEKPLQDLIKSYVGMDMSWLKSISLTCDGYINGGDITAKGNIGLNGVGVLDYDSAISTADQAVLFRLPSISDAYLATPLNTATNYDPTAFSKMADMLPDQQRINNIVKRYGDILVKDITNVEKTTADMTVGSVTQSCTRLDANINAETAKKLAQDVAASIKSDNDLIAIIDSAITASGQKGLSSAEIVNQISKTLENVANSSTGSSGTSAIYTIYTNGNDEIVGTEISVNTGSGSPVPVVKCLAPVSGGNSALDFEIYMGQYNLSLTGTGNGSDTSHSGKYTLALNYENLLDIDVENYNIKDAAKGEINGSFTLKLADGAMDLIRNASSDIASMARLIESYSLKFDISSSGTSSDCKMSLIDNSNSPLLSFDVKTDVNSGTKLNPALPSGSDKVYNASDSGQIQQYMSGIRLDSVINALKQANVPSQYTDMLSSLAAQLR